MIKVQKKDFDIEKEIKFLKDQYSNVGAVNSFVGYVKNYLGGVTEFPLGYRAEPHNAGQRTIEWFENPASDKQGYTKTLEMRKGKPNTAVIIFTPIDPMGENSPSALYDELKLQGQA